MKLVTTSVKRPVGVVMIVLAILALGFVSLRNLAVDLFPEIELPIAVVATSYQDAAPEDVENLISRPIEGAVSTIEGIDSIQSRSQTGASVVIMMFKNGTDLDQALLDVREKVDQVKGFLPNEAEEPNILRFSPDALPVMWVSLTGSEPERLTEIAENQVVPYFERQEGIASVTVEGGKEREIQVILESTDLKQYGISANEVAQAISATNNSASVGTVEKGNQDLQLRVIGEIESIDDIKETIIQTPAGATISVEDVAEVVDTYKESDSLTLVNGEPSLVLSIMKNTDANTVEVATNIRDSIPGIEAELGESVAVDVIIDTSEFIQLSIDSVTSNIIIGGLIAIGILLLFLKSIRATIVIGVLIPIALISTFALMYFTGQTLNVLTLGGLALGVGMMVDSSIVILENIYSYRRRGASLYEAATKGASELTPALIASTTTTIVVFLPIVFVEGFASDLFTPLALTVSFALVASLVVAITLVPMLSSQLLSKVVDKDGKTYWFERFLNWLRDKYANGLRRTLKFRKTTVLITFLILGGSFALIPMIGAELIPASDQGQARISVETESGSSLEYVEGIVEQINEKLIAYEEDIEVSFLSVGGDGVGPGGGSSNNATYTIQLVPLDERDISTNDFVKNIEEDLRDIAGAEITVSMMESGMNFGDPISIEINGPEHEVLRDLADEVAEEISTVDGVLNPTSGAAQGIPQLTIRIDEGHAAMYGLTEQQITGQIQPHFNGQLATRYRERRQEIDVMLYYPEDERSTIHDLMELNIQTPTGASIPLNEVAEFIEIQGPVALMRQNQQPQMNVTSQIIDRDLGSIVEDVEARLAQMNLPEGYNYTVAGQAEEMEEAFIDLGLALIFSIFLVYAVMAIQFESFLYPFIIMFAIPTSAIGVLLGLFATDIALSVPAIIGITMLAGVVVNNSILLVDYTNLLRERGMERMEAIVEAGRNRLRPILMTTITTVLALIPLSLGIGEGAELQQPLAVTVIFGLSTSSIFTLFLVPVIYLLLDNLSKKIKVK
ncbi:efflux RND transporter permease subunit [Oceanobacillus luteolus]|uniref:efflux RND transporter permease subunit n=1 Tax=Oceanobacillus luteolus TaxID=1274358 RepID=UPI00203ABC89|nr:efflux RND transporter permease subunit [Oceanobacillus luteolus]MCM3741637.1 efflux RND transporter permease subunit [Oceanobacillus luteolus]